MTFLTSLLTVYCHNELYSVIRTFNVVFLPMTYYYPGKLYIS